MVEELPHGTILDQEELGLGNTRTLQRDPAEMHSFTLLRCRCPVGPSRQLCEWLQPSQSCSPNLLATPRLLSLLLWQNTA